MPALTLPRAALQPYAHQLVGVERMTALVEPELGRVIPGCFALFDEMGAGKTKQVCDSAQVLFEAGEIDTVIVVCPAYVRGVWFDPKIGEIQKHLWSDMSVLVIEYHNADRRWIRGTSDRRLRWIVTNFEYFRKKVDKRGEGRRKKPKRTSAKLEALKEIANSKTLLVVDESAAVKSPTSSSTISTAELARNCGWRWILNGTPITKGLGDLYGQMMVLDPRILGYESWWQFRSNHAILGGWQGKQIVGWRHIEEVQRAIAPYVLRRKTSECLDLPEKLPPVTIPVVLDQTTWAVYKSMKKDAVAWLRENLMSSSAQSGSKVMRLAQITSGHLGGLTEQTLCETCEGVGGDEVGACESCGGAGMKSARVPDQRVGTGEKLNTLKEWHANLLEEQPNAKVIVWCRFRAQIEDILNTFGDQKGLEIGSLWGGQGKEDRERSIAMLHPSTANPDVPSILAGIPSSGGVGINLAAASHVLWYGHGTSLLHRLQADDRAYRPGQTRRLWYGDLVATGPDGQKTIDHDLVEALRKKDDVANWTCSAWLSKLEEE